MYMRKFLERLSVFAVAVALCVGIIASFAPASAARAEESKVIDMYLIAGQSNAAGSTAKGGATGSYGNVMYGGQTNMFMNGSIATSYVSFNSFRCPVVPGLGATVSQIGPELGMAKVLNDRYSADNKCFIFKSATGNTALLDKQTYSGSGIPLGNWYPRSLWPSNNKQDYTGYQYEKFISNFSRVYSELRANGYTPKIKGLAWMQGEADLGRASEYKPVLKQFITDVRSELAEITGDYELTGMPFVIGEIATSFGSYDNPSVPPMNAVQREVAAEMDGVYSFSTADLIINDKDGNMLNGVDKYHYQWQDVITLGERFAEAIVTAQGDKIINVASNNAMFGSATGDYDKDANTLTLSVKPAAQYKLGSLLVNGVEKSGDVANGKLVLSDIPARVFVSATFVKKEVLFVGADSDDKGRITVVDTVYENSAVKAKVQPNAGYVVTKVMFGDTEMTYNEKSGCYECVSGTENGRVTAVFELENPEQNSGCGSSGAAVALGSIIMLVGAVLMLKIK